MRLLCFVALIGAAINIGSASSIASFPYFDDSFRGKPYSVSYDRRALTLAKLSDDAVEGPSNTDKHKSSSGASHVVFLSGSVHPPRISSTVEGLERVFGRMRQNGLNMVQLYTFWNWHEPHAPTSNNVSHYEHLADLSRFVEVAGRMGLFVDLRIGPYVCAEWDNGGIPRWLGFETDVAYRTVNNVFQTHMERFFRAIVNALEDYFPVHGGPIVLVQVENELPPASKTYVDWCGNMAASALANTPVPIIMCNGESAPNTINTCNGNSCVSFLEKNGQSGQILVSQPALWTEDEGGFQTWGERPAPTEPVYFWGRTAADTAFEILRWFARGGTHHNYYMYTGGNNWEYPGASLTTMYASDAPLCPDGLPHEPKYSHLGYLHALIREFATDVLSVDAQLRNFTTLAPIGHGEPVRVYLYGRVSFLENSATTSVSVSWLDTIFQISALSVTVVENREGHAVVRFNSATPAVKILAMREVQTVVAPPQIRWLATTEQNQFSWGFPVVAASHPLEQTSVTSSSFLYYEINATLSHVLPRNSTLFFTGSVGVVFTLLIDGEAAGETWNVEHGDIGGPGGRVSFKIALDKPLSAGAHHFSLLSCSLGLPNDMDVGSTRKLKGILSDVIFDAGVRTSGKWLMRPSLAGELKHLPSFPEKAAEWKEIDSRSAISPLTWLWAQVSIPPLGNSDGALFLNLTGLNRGRLWIEGADAGNYWTVNGTQTLYELRGVRSSWSVRQINVVLVELAGSMCGMRDVSVSHSRFHASAGEYPTEKSLQQILTCTM